MFRVEITRVDGELETRLFADRDDADEWALERLADPAVEEGRLLVLPEPIQVADYRVIRWRQEAK